jgi:hypothetical protein
MMKVGPEKQEGVVIRLERKERAEDVKVVKAKVVKAKVAEAIETVKEEIPHPHSGERTKEVLNLKEAAKN